MPLADQDILNSVFAMTIATQNGPTLPNPIQNINLINDAVNRFNGGWEVWLQLQMAAYLAAQYPAAQFRREVTIVAGSICDFMIQGDRGLPYYVELKVQLHSDNNASLFARFQSDLTKINAYPQAIRQAGVFRCYLYVHTPLVFFANSDQLMGFLRGVSADYLGGTNAYQLFPRAGVVTIDPTGGVMPNLNTPLLCVYKPSW